MLQLVLVP